MEGIKSSDARSDITRTPDEGYHLTIGIIRSDYPYSSSGAWSCELRNKSRFARKEHFSTRIMMVDRPPALWIEN